MRIEFQMLHSHEHGWAPDEIGLFIDSHCRPGAVPLAKLGAPQVSEHSIDVPYSSAVLGKSAALHFTTDPGPRSQRVWQRLDATIVPESITAPALPASTNTWFITLTDQRGATVSTAPMIVA